MPLKDIEGINIPAPGTKTDPRDEASYFEGQNIFESPEQLSARLAEESPGLHFIDTVRKGISKTFFNIRDSFDDQNEVANFIFGDKPLRQEIEQRDYNFIKPFDYLKTSIYRGYQEGLDRRFSLDDIRNISDAVTGTYDNEEKLSKLFLQQKYPFINWKKDLPRSAVEKRVEQYKSNNSYIFDGSLNSEHSSYENEFLSTAGGFVGGAGSALTDPVSIGIGLATFALTRKVGLGTGALFTATNIIADNALYVVAEKSLTGLGDFIQGSESDDLSAKSITSEFLFGTLFHGIFAGVGKIFGKSKPKGDFGGVPPSSFDGVKNPVTNKVAQFIDESVNNLREYSGNIFWKEDAENIAKGMANASERIVYGEADDGVARTLSDSYNSSIDNYLAGNEAFNRSSVNSKFDDFNNVNNIDNVDRLDYNNKIDEHNAQTFDPTKSQEAIDNNINKAVQRNFGVLFEKLKAFEPSQAIKKVKEFAKCKIGK